MTGIVYLLFGYYIYKYLVLANAAIIGGYVGGCCARGKKWLSGSGRGAGRFRLLRDHVADDEIRRRRHGWNFWRSVRREHMECGRT